LDNGKDKDTPKKKPKEEFLGKVDFFNLKKELGMKNVEDIGSFVKLSNPKNAYNWDKDKENHGTRPSYNAIVQMLKSGASVESLFGVEYNRMESKTNDDIDEKAYNSPEFKRGVAKAIEELKKMGVIKDVL